ncbi:MAG TPA: hypothetical protein V6D29_10300 [Leptolyngbyaceae cyanobacterium]
MRQRDRTDPHGQYDYLSALAKAQHPIAFSVGESAEIMMLKRAFSARERPKNWETGRI